MTEPIDDTGTHAPQANLRFLCQHPAHFIALGLGSGLSPKAPGTVGTLFAWLTFDLLLIRLQPLYLWTFLLFAGVIGIWLIDMAGRHLHEPDHQSIVWDEIVPFWLVLSLSPSGFYWHLAAFILFRLFDITKPQPARYFDEKVKNGFGVMADDVVAALYTLLCIGGFQLLLGWFWTSH